MTASPAGIRRRTRSRRLLAAGWRLALAILVVIGVVPAVAAATTPSVDDAARRVASIDAAHGSAPAPVATTDRIAVAGVAAVDGRSHSHRQVDALALVRALWGRLSGTDAGGSTLDRQLVRGTGKQACSLATRFLDGSSKRSLS